MTSFEQLVAAALPVVCMSQASEAAKALDPFVHHDYPSSAIEAIVGGEIVRIPLRIHFTGQRRLRWLYGASTELVFQCLRTRSTDGFERQKGLQAIVGANEPWVIPFVMLLTGEYVIEIVREVAAAVQTLDRKSYVNFVRENRFLMQLLRQKAVSYWNCYYRTEYPNKQLYPGLILLDQLEDWAQ